MSSPSLEDLAARLAVLEDERLILQTLHRYGHAIDYGHEQDWVGCFTDDGVFDVRSRSGETFICVEGHDQLLAFIKGHTRPPAAYHRHFVADALIELDGDEASVDSYFARVDAADEGRPSVIVAMGRYRDRLTRCPDGVWRFSLRLAEMQNA